MNSASLILYASGAFIVTVILGFWLGRLGKPYQEVLFNIHKLLALAAVVLVGLEFSHLFKSRDIHSELILLMILIALLVISLFASGALMSLDKGNFKLLQWSHRIAPIVLIGLGCLDDCCCLVTGFSGVSSSSK